jgi:hypothetical protein
VLPLQECHNFRNDDDHAVYLTGEQNSAGVTLSEIFRKKNMLISSNILFGELIPHVGRQSLISGEVRDLLPSQAYPVVTKSPFPKE